MGAVEIYRDALFGSPPSPTTEPSREGSLAAFTVLAQSVSGAVAGIAYYATGAERAADNNKPIGTLAKAANEADYYRYTSTGWVVDNTVYEGVVSLVQPIIDEGTASAAADADRAEAAADVYTSRFTEVIPPADGPFADAVALTADTITGALVGATLADGSTYDPVSARRDILAIGPRTSSRGMVVGVVSQGQSNASIEYNFSQRPGDTNRVPDYFDASIDGPTIITADRSPLVTTFNGSALVPFVGAPYGAFTGNHAAGEGPLAGFTGQMLARHPGMRMCVSVAGAQGATPLSALRRPTNAEIDAGQMVATDRTVTIGAGSLEKQWRASALTLRDLWTLTGAPATPWFKDAWSQSMIRHLHAVQGYVYVVGYMPMQHGEAMPTEPYTGALADFYDEKQACWREITGQQFDALMVMEVASYAPFYEIAGSAGYDAWLASGKLESYKPGGANSQYLPELQRSNLMFGRDIEIARGQRFGGRRIVISGPKYAMTSLIHHDQWTARWTGEVMAYRAWQEDFSGREARPLEPVSVDFVDANHVTVRFDRRVQLKPPVRNGNTNNPWGGAGTGMPFGFTFYYGDGVGVRPIADNGVVVGADGYSIEITTAAGPIDRGHILSYVNFDRTGSICTVDQLPLIYPDRDGGVTEAREYCIPFRRAVA